MTAIRPELIEDHERDRRRHRRIMRSLKLLEISAVDKPANEHARMTIMKRADDHLPPPFSEDSSMALSDIVLAAEELHAVQHSHTNPALLAKAAGIHRRDLQARMAKIGQAGFMAALDLHVAHCKRAGESEAQCHLWLAGGDQLYGRLYEAFRHCKQSGSTGMAAVAKTARQHVDADLVRRVDAARQPGESFVATFDRIMAGDPSFRTAASARESLKAIGG